MPYNYHDCEVIDVLDEAPGVKRYYLKYPDPNKLEFKAGQFVMFDLPIDSKYTNRSYSIASAPSNDNILELVIVINPQGLGTPHLFEEVKVGSILKTSFPLGKFHLDEDLNRHICFICTGTGIAPFRSMILDILNTKREFHQITLLFGVRTQKDILYRTEFEELEKSNPKFKFIPVLSREKWQGRTGYVHEVYLEMFKEPGSHLFYLCGWANMLKEARENLKDLVLDRKQIRFESYD
ncbi:MAG: FAD-binding oxidoreductase [Bacteroidia bacterium]